MPRGAPGLTIVDNWSSFGQRTTASGNVVIDNVRVGPEAVIPVYLGAERPSSNGSVSQIIQAAVDAGIARGATRRRSRLYASMSGLGSIADKSTATRMFLRSRKSVISKSSSTPPRRCWSRAGRAIDGILNDPSDEAAAEAAVKVAEAKVLTTEIAILATNKLHELGGTRSTLGEFNFDRHWRNARTHTLHDPVRWKYFHIGNHLLNGIGPPRHAWS